MNRRPVPGGNPPFIPYNPVYGYEPRGIGGGGAMSAFSMSPYSPLTFVGTDMGTLFRSVDNGTTWNPIAHSQATFSSDLNSASYVGFSADPNVVFYARAGVSPKRSTDQGVTWQSIPGLSLNSGEKIKYWVPDSSDPDVIFCATTARLLRTDDKGLNWTAVPGVSGAALGTFLDYDGATIYHAVQGGVLSSADWGQSFSMAFAAPGTGIRGFAGGRDASGVSLAYIDRDGANACAWASTKPGVTAGQITGTQNDCGYVWVKRGTAPFSRTNQEGGRYIRMAENDSQTIYVTGGQWMRQYGSKVWVSRNAGQSWGLKLHQYNWDVNPYAPWPADRLEYSPPGLEVGWDDNAYESFSVNQRDSSVVGGTGYYFLHVSRDYGEHWKAPFTEFADVGSRSKGKVWKSTGLEVTSVLRLKFHPADPSIGYAVLADMAGLVTEDSGTSWRVTKAQYNTNYDYAFDPSNTQRVYAVSGATHDWPENGNSGVIVGNDGVYRSDNRGRNWTRLTAGGGGAFDRQFLSLAFDASRNTLYAGSQGAGVARSTDGGATWAYFNTGFPGSTQIIPQIEIDPANGNVYALLTGDAPGFTNSAVTGIYFLDVVNGSTTWTLLRGTVVRPSGSGSYALMQYPTCFAVDWSRAARDTFWLGDTESHGQWMATGIWKTTDRGATWTRKTQYTHPRSIEIDPMDADRVYVGGSWEVGGTWGKGGAFHTTDGGTNWTKTTDFPLEANLRATVLDPNNSGGLFYLFFGGGMLYGPRP